MKNKKCVACGKQISFYATRCCSCSRKWQYKHDLIYKARWDNLAKNRGKYGFKKGNVYGKRFVKGQRPTNGSFKKGHKFSDATILHFRRIRLGIHNSPQTEFKPTTRNRQHRRSYHLLTPEYNAWRKKVFLRDDYTCQKCNTRGGYLEAHHKHPWVTHNKERYWVKNGATLCKKCHLELHKRSI